MLAHAEASLAMAIAIAIAIAIDDAEQIAVSFSLRAKGLHSSGQLEQAPAGLRASWCHSPNAGEPVLAGRSLEPFWPNCTAAAGRSKPPKPAVRRRSTFVASCGHDQANVTLVVHWRTPLAERRRRRRAIVGSNATLARSASQVRIRD